MSFRRIELEWDGSRVKGFHAIAPQRLTVDRTVSPGSNADANVSG